jgi:tetratricopeptide (TPR) repeat protein
MLLQCRSFPTIIVLLQFLTPGLAQRNAASEPRLQQGAQARTDVGDLLTKYQRALSAHPNSPGLHVAIAELFFQTKQFPLAIQSYEQALRLDGSNEKAAIGLARAYREVFNYDEARRVLEAASARHPRSGAPLAELGKLDIHLQHYDQAIHELQQAVKRQPSLVETHTDLGVAYQAKGNPKEALEQFDEALRLDAASASAHYFRGLLYADSDDNQRAYEDVRKAYDLDLSSRPARALLGKVATRLGRCEEAVRVLKPLTEVTNVETENVFLLARAYQCAKQPDLAKQAQEQFERRSKQEESARTQKMDADHLAGQAAEFARKNQLEAAMELLNQALAKDPENGPSHALLAKIHFSRGNVPASRKEIEEALRSNPLNPEYLYVLGKVLEKQGDSAGALGAFQKTVLIDPRESDAYYEMSQIYARTGQRQRALDAIQTAMKISPDDPDYKKALIDLQGQKH